jgi:hypothetical protein
MWQCILIDGLQSDLGLAQRGEISSGCEAPVTPAPHPSPRRSRRTPLQRDHHQDRGGIARGRRGDGEHRVAHSATTTGRERQIVHGLRSCISV